MTKQFKEHLALRKQLRMLNLLANLTAFIIVVAVIAIDVVRYMWR